MRRKIGLIFVMVGIFVVSGCQTLPAAIPGEAGITASPLPQVTLTPPSATAPAETLTSTALPAEPTETGVSQGQQSLDKLVADLAVEDLAQRLGIPASEIQVVSVITQELPVQNLGCPQKLPTGGPDVQGEVMGKVIRLQAGDTIYEYRARGRDLVYCKS